MYKLILFYGFLISLVPTDELTPVVVVPVDNLNPIFMPSPLADMKPLAEDDVLMAADPLDGLTHGISLGALQKITPERAGMVGVQDHEQEVRRPSFASISPQPVAARKVSMARPVPRAIPVAGAQSAVARTALPRRTEANLPAVASAGSSFEDFLKTATERPPAVVKPGILRTVILCQVQIVGPLAALSDRMLIMIEEYKKSEFCFHCLIDKQTITTCASCDLRKSLCFGCCKPRHGECKEQVKVQIVADLCKWCFFPQKDHVECRAGNSSPLRDAVKYIHVLKGKGKVTTTEAISFIVTLWERRTRNR